MNEIIAHVQMPTNWVDILFTAASILISIVAVFISVQTFRSQKEQNKNSVRPILNVSVGDYEDNIYVRLHNNGVGPAIITRIQCNVRRVLFCTEQGFLLRTSDFKWSLWILQSSSRTMYFTLKSQPPHVPPIMTVLLSYLIKI